MFIFLLILRGRLSGKTERNLDFVAEVGKSISLIFLSIYIAITEIENKPYVVCFCQKPFYFEKNKKICLRGRSDKFAKF